MSNWVHVNGVFRIDSIRSIDPEFKPEEIFGKQCLFKDSEEVWNDFSDNPDDFLPAGSEGTCEMSVWEDPDPCSIAAYTVSIFGDLRDCNSTNNILQYFIKVCRKINKNYMIRQAVITAESEVIDQTRTITFINDEIKEIIYNPDGTILNTVYLLDEM